MRLFALSKRRYIGYLVTLIFGFSQAAWCQQNEHAEPDLYSRIWSTAVFHEDQENQTIQSFSLIGRYHGQFWTVHADRGNAHDWENRRRIAGFSSRWFKHFKLQAQAYINTSNGSLYNGLYEAFIEWSPPDVDFTISAGRLDYLFTGLERSRSSKKINTIERGLLVNQVMPAEVVGAHLQGKRGKFSYHAGLFSNSIEEEFDDFDTGASAVIGVAYDTDWLFEEGTLHLDYLHKSGDVEGNAFKPYQYITSLWHMGKLGRFEMGADLTLAKPLETPGHVWGLTLEPTWVMLDELLGNNDPLQLALRFQYVASDEDNGLHLQRRYEQKVTRGEGDHYQAFYAGLNYLLYGHKLKLMLGGEYARMKDHTNDGGEYRGWTWVGAVRLYF